MRFLKAACAALLGAAFSFSAAQAQMTPAQTTNGSVSITTGSTFQTVLSATTYPTIRRSLTIENNNTNGDSCWVFVGGGAATKATSLLLTQGGSYQRYFPYVPSDAIQATCATNNDTLYIDTQ